MNLDHGSRAIGTVDPWLVISAGFLRICLMLNHAGDPQFSPSLGLVERQQTEWRGKAESKV